MKTPQEIAEQIIADPALGYRGEPLIDLAESHNFPCVPEAIVAAIEADRAQRYDSDAVSDIREAIDRHLMLEDNRAWGELEGQDLNALAAFLAAEGFTRP